MLVKDYSFKLSDFHIHHLDALLPEDALLMDIETTGFQAAYQNIYLIGLGFRKGETITLRLLYAPTLEEEESILKEYQSTLKEFQRLITFNGDMFDLPFIEKRCQKYKIESIQNTLVSTDLFKIAKKYKKYLNLEHYKQKDLEHYFGLFREDKFNGGQLIDIYKKQAIEPNVSETELLFLHNMEDVKGMVTLLQLLDFSLLKNNEYKVKTQFFDGEEIYFELEASSYSNLNIKYIGSFYYLQWKGNTLSGNLRPYIGKLKYFYKDYKNYVYISDEDLLLPKALASTIEKSRIQKATKEQCFVEKDSVFLIDHANFSEQHFKEDFKAKETYMEIHPNELKEGFLTEYITSLL